jgi:putative redox protein
MRSVAKLKSYTMSATSRGVGCVVHTSTGHTLQTDLPRPVGGLDQAAQPVELLLAGLLGCKTATAHFVARHLWPRPHNRLAAIEFVDVVADRDERGAIHLPIRDKPSVTAALFSVRGVVHVMPAPGAIDHITPKDVEMLGEIVEQRCPVAATLLAAGCQLDFQWQLRAASSETSSFVTRHVSRVRCVH